MNWWPKRNNNNNTHIINYSDAVYIPPSRYGTFIFRDENSNNLKIISKRSNNFTSSDDLITKYKYTSPSMKSTKIRSYLNYNYESPVTYTNRGSKHPKLRINQPSLFSNSKSIEKSKTNYEPFTPLNSKQIKTFNRIMYLPKPKINNPVSENNELIENQKAYELPPVIKKNPAYSGIFVKHI